MGRVHDARIGPVERKKPADHRSGEDLSPLSFSFHGLSAFCRRISHRRRGSGPLAAHRSLLLSLLSLLSEVWSWRETATQLTADIMTTAGDVTISEMAFGMECPTCLDDADCNGPALHAHTVERLTQTCTTATSTGSGWHATQECVTQEHNNRTATQEHVISHWSRSQPTQASAHVTSHHVDQSHTQSHPAHWPQSHP